MCTEPLGPVGVSGEPVSRLSAVLFEATVTELHLVSYPGQNPEPRPDTAVLPASLHHLHTQYTSVLSSGTQGTPSTQCYYDDRGYPPCSSSLLDPELPSSQQLLVLVPLPDRFFPPGFGTAPGPLLPPPAGALPLLFPGASGFLSSIAGMWSTELARARC